MPFQHITTIPLHNPPPGRGGDAIDDIYARGAAISLKQADRHTILLDIGITGEQQSFRFESATPGKGPGIRLRSSPPPLPGAQRPRPGCPDEIAAYNLRQGTLHIERLTQSQYWIGISAGARDGTLYAETRGGRKNRIILRQITTDHSTVAD